MPLDRPVTPTNDENERTPPAPTPQENQGGRAAYHGLPARPVMAKATSTLSIQSDAVALGTTTENSLAVAVVSDSPASSFKETLINARPGNASRSSNKIQTAPKAIPLAAVQTSRRDSTVSNSSAWSASSSSKGRQAGSPAMVALRSAPTAALQASPEFEGVPADISLSFGPATWSANARDANTSNGSNASRASLLSLNAPPATPTATSQGSGSSFFNSMNKFANTLTTYRSVPPQEFPEAPEERPLETPHGVSLAVTPTTSEAPVLSFRKTPKRESGSGSALEARLQGQLHQRAASYDPGLFIDAKFMDTGYRFATGQRDADFHMVFPSVSPSDRLLDDFSCALSRDILLQGRIYVSEHHLCFNLNLLGWVTSVVVPHSEIVGFEKRSTAGIFPNAIAVLTTTEVHTLASFVSRDAVFDFLQVIWGKAVKPDGPEQTKVVDRPRFPSRLSLASTDMAHALLGNESTLFGLAAASDRESLEDAIRSVILSIDGDDDERVPVAYIKAKADSGYTNPGPPAHPPTSPTVDWEGNEEIKVREETFRAPLGLVHNVIFGENTEFHRAFIAKCDGSELSEYGPFVDNERHFTYQKALGYAIGPASTKCVVMEEQLEVDYERCIVMVSTTRTPDVPSGGVFSVHTRYIMTWAEDNQTTLLLTYWIEWTGRSWVRGMIEKSTHTGQLDAAAKLSELLAAKLEAITERGVSGSVGRSPIREDSACSTLKAGVSSWPSEKAPVPPPVRAAEIGLERYASHLVVVLFVLVGILFVSQIRMATSIKHSNEVMQGWMQMVGDDRGDQETRDDVLKLVQAAFVKRKSASEIQAELERQVRSYFN